MTGDFIRRGKCHVKAETQGEGHVKTEAEIRVTQPQAEEHPEPGSWKRQEGVCPRADTLILGCRPPEP